MLNTLSLPRVSDLARIALFLDLDGTLVEIVEHPQNVHVEPATLELLARLAARLEGAIAIVSGRPIEDIDRLFSPLALPVAGVHGLMRRDATGRMLAAPLDGSAMASVREALELALGRPSGLFIEAKPGAVAVHYRSRPELQQTCYEAVSNLVDGRTDLELIHGKMVFEIKLKGPSKGTAIAEFMSEPPFLGRLPVFAGDDVTDENGFAVIDALGGHSIKVGPGPTRAHWRAQTAAELLDWLGALASVEGP
jgi:trehalose 6-phosphate phosphatase